MVHNISDDIVEALMPIRSIKDTLNRGERKDNRSLTKFRKPTISCDVFPNFDGSASVGVDGACIMVGVTGLVHTSARRSVVVRVVKSVFAKEQGLDSEFSALTTSLERLINGAINFDALHVAEHLYYSLELDVQILESNGPLLSLSLLASLAALLSTRLPKHVTLGRDLKVRAESVDKKSMAYVPMLCLPSVAAFVAHELQKEEENMDNDAPNFRWIPDPSAAEAASAHVKFSVLAQSPVSFDKDAAPAFDRTWSLDSLEDKRTKLATAAAIARFTNKEVTPINLLTPANVQDLISTGSELWTLAEKEAEAQISALRKACKGFFKAGADGQLKQVVVAPKESGMETDE